MRRRTTSAGYSFVELMVSISIVGLAMLVTLQQLTISYRENGINEARVFAYQKATAMLAEIQAGIEQGTIADGDALDGMADAGLPNPVLTTVLVNGEPPAPDHVMSGNFSRDGVWLWGRLLDIEKVPMQDQIRYVKIRVVQPDSSGRFSTMATVAGLVTLPIKGFTPITTYDVYVLALAEAPSAWMPMPSLRTLIENASEEIESSASGLDLRLHWITRMGYGRDVAYVPWINQSVAATDAAPYVYWYPGNIGGSGIASLFTPEYFSGRVRTEGGVRNDFDAGLNPHPHAVADQWNHCLRLPQAQALFSQRVADGVENEGEPPLQLLLEDMYARPDRYRNAIFVNLHGEGVPFPPLRNYADAARSPLARPGVRVVTHPSRLRPARDPDGDGNHADTDDLELRVHAYKTDPAAGAAVLVEPITLQIFGVDLTQNINGADGALPTTLEVRRLPGGIDPATGLAVGLGRDYHGFDDPEGLPPAAAGAPTPFEMYFTAGYVSGPQPYTWIRLYDTPLCAPVFAGQGLPATERLYGLEYVPSVVGSGGAFVDLTDAGGGPKNTARWRISIPKAIFEPGFPGGGLSNVDQLMTVSTRIGTDMTTGVMWPVANDPANLSTTWAWWASSPQAVPLTERFQLQGDPRHNPYADLAAGGASFPNGYNWHFDDLRHLANDATPKWPCLDAARLRDGFGAGAIVDAPRMLQIWRDALQRCGGVFVNGAGITAQSVLNGGEIALPPATPGAGLTPLTLHGDLFATGAPVMVDSVDPDPGLSVVKLGREVVLESGGTPTFWAKEWLGELAPDTAAAGWLATGNLPTGVTALTFHREERSLFEPAELPSGTTFTFGSGAQMGAPGTAAWLQSGSSAGTFQHQAAAPGSTADLAAPGQEIDKAAGAKLLTPAACLEPFALDVPAGTPLTNFPFVDSYPQSTASILEQYYIAPGAQSAAAAIQLRGPTAGESAFYAVLGLTPSAVPEHESLARATLLLGVRTFHKAGEPTMLERITQPGRVEILSPSEGATLLYPADMLVRWKVAFLRFDGELYTDAYPATFSEPESDLRYVVIYSSDKGDSWRYAATGDPAVAGQRPSNPALLQDDSGLGNESYLLPLPSGLFPSGEYWLRVECYHATRLVHMSYHQVRVVIVR